MTRHAMFCPLVRRSTVLPMTCLTIAVTITFAFPPQLATAKKWTDDTEKYSIEAEFVDLQDGMVRLRKSNGDVVRVPIQKLSGGDQDYVRLRLAEPHDEQPSVGGRQEIPAIGNSKELSETIKRGPLCGVRVTVSGDTEELRDKAAIIVTQRLDGLTENAPQRSAWLRKLDVFMTTKWPDESNDPSLRSVAELIYFLGKMGVLFDKDGKLKNELSNRLLARADNLPKQEREVWTKAIETILNDDSFQKGVADRYAMRGRSIVDGQVLTASPQDVIHSEVGLTLLLAEPLYTNEHYDLAKAAKYLARLRQLSLKDIRDFISAAPNFTNAEVDAAISLTLCDALFPKEKFDRKTLEQLLSRRPPKKTRHGGGKLRSPTTSASGGRGGRLAKRRPKRSMSESQKRRAKEQQKADAIRQQLGDAPWYVVMLTKEEITRYSRMTVTRHSIRTTGQEKRYSVKIEVAEGSDAALKLILAHLADHSPISRWAEIPIATPRYVFWPFKDQNTAEAFRQSQLMRARASGFR